MKWFLAIRILLITLPFPEECYCQEIPTGNEQQLENKSEQDQAETEDDGWLQDLDQFRREPLNLNTADEDELNQLHILTELQIANLISYRQLLGSLINIYELQAVPGWDLITIKKILPFVLVALPGSLIEGFKKRFHGSEHSLLLRISQVLERSAGFDKSARGDKYLGSPQRIFFRYRYNYKKLLQWGLLGDKDAGESFARGVQKMGFDFYSFHVFARSRGVIRCLAVGDFTVNLGQGLIEWQGLAFKKSGEVMNVKRQSSALSPYSSAGEYNFHRGAGITIRKGRIECTAFASFRQLSANLGMDTANNKKYITSFLTSGYHRTLSERKERGDLFQTAFGGSIRYRGKGWQVGWNAVHYHFSLPIRKRNEPYNLYAIQGNSWYSAGMDYCYTYRNFHFFGEIAADKHFSSAFVNGLLISVAPGADLSFVHRNIPAAYQSIAGNAFTENTYPGNEKGLYSGVSIRPAPSWRLEAYADIFKFPWLKYLEDAPGRGSDFLAQLTYTPNKQVEIYSRFRNENRQNTGTPGKGPRQSWRTQAMVKINTEISVRNRIEILCYDPRGKAREDGFLAFTDFIYKPVLKRYSGTLRLQYFETGGYNSRVYAYENDVLYSFSIPSFAGKGFRYYLNFNYDPGKKISFWLRWARTTYTGGGSIGSGMDEIPGHRKTEIKLQSRWVF